jgi:hypothetical protein
LLPSHEEKLAAIVAGAAPYHDPLLQVGGRSSGGGDLMMDTPSIPATDELLAGSYECLVDRMHTTGPLGLRMLRVEANMVQEVDTVRARMLVARASHQLIGITVVGDRLTLHCTKLPLAQELLADGSLRPIPRDHINHNGEIDDEENDEDDEWAIHYSVEDSSNLNEIHAFLRAKLDRQQHAGDNHSKSSSKRRQSNAGTGNAEIDDVLNSDDDDAELGLTSPLSGGPAILVFAAADPLPMQQPPPPQASLHEPLVRTTAPASPTLVVNGNKNNQSSVSPRRQSHDNLPTGPAPSGIAMSLAAAASSSSISGNNTSGNVDTNGSATHSPFIRPSVAPLTTTSPSFSGSPPLIGSHGSGGSSGGNHTPSPTQTTDNRNRVAMSHDSTTAPSSFARDIPSSMGSGSYVGSITGPLSLGGASSSLLSSSALHTTNDVPRSAAVAVSGTRTNNNGHHSRSPSIGSLPTGGNHSVVATSLLSSSPTISTTHHHPHTTMHSLPTADATTHGSLLASSTSGRTISSGSPPTTSPTSASPVSSPGNSVTKATAPPESPSPTTSPGVSVTKFSAPPSPSPLPPSRSASSITATVNVPVSSPVSSTSTTTSRPGSRRNSGAAISSSVTPSSMVPSLMIWMHQV